MNVLEFEEKIETIQNWLHKANEIQDYDLVNTETYYSKRLDLAANFLSHSVKKILSTIFSAEDTVGIVLRHDGEDFSVRFNDSLGISCLESLVIGVAEISGRVFSIAEDQNGPIQHILPTQAGERGQHNREIQYHIDAEVLGIIGPHHVPKGIALACVENENCTPTNIVTINEVISKLSDEIVHELQRPMFWCPVPSPLEKAIGRQILMPVLSTDFSGTIEFAASPFSLLGKNNAAKRCLKTLHNAIAQSKEKDISLKSGEIFLFNQRRVLHSRPSFIGRRHLLRVFIQERSVHTNGYFQRKKCAMQLFSQHNL